MRIDAHAHFEPRMLELDRLIAKLDDVGVGKVALIPALNDPLPKTPERLLAVVRRLMQSSVTRPLAELIHRTTLTRDGDLKLSREVYRIYAQPDNGAVADAIRLYPDRLMGWIFLNPKGNPAVLEQLERWRAEPGMIGVKLHPHWHDYRTDLLHPLLARVEELGLPVLIHLGFGPRGDYRALLDRYPRLRMIAAHAGFPFYQSMFKHAGDHPNLMVDLSSPYIDEALTRRAVAALGPERCLYGTDAPYGFHAEDDSYDYSEICGWIERLPISSAEQERVFGGNFERLLSESGG
ncbi:MAG: putative TIM-barrel fold metal-dependent hydrolase [Myxococcota bacterium]|jgi:predicted TIM-barrel fold metal-dependent hydrolase